MSSITKDANLGLMKLVVITLTILVAVTVYYQYSFADVYDSYEQHVDLLKEKESDIEKYRIVLKEAKEDLDINSEREEILGDQILTLRQSEEDSGFYKQEVERLMIELAKEQQKTALLNHELGFHDVNMDDLLIEIEELKEEVDELKDEKRALLDRL